MAQRRTSWVAAWVATAAAASVFAAAAENGEKPLPQVPQPIQIHRGLSKLEQSCIECHAKTTPGMVRDWAQSAHARANVTCVDCHRVQPKDRGAHDCPGTVGHPDVKITPVVTPATCGVCHTAEAKEFARSKHARTWELQTKVVKDNFLRGMNSEIERAMGCYMCHGSDLSSGELTSLNWPNVGIGRLNPDGSKGSCNSCHTKHRFSVAEARKPEACGICHLGPDHPQDEIYFGSRHGKRYLAEHTKWNFDAAPEAWLPGVDYSAPTCAACHLSGVGGLAVTHDVGERLKWVNRLPMSIPNPIHDPKQAREKMTTVCVQCHSPRWASNYLDRFDQTVVNWNETYFKPIKATMDDLYAKGILTKWPMFDEEIEYVYYELWHHEGHRARMGAAMMSADFTWWHGFYEVKRNYNRFIQLAEAARAKGHGDPTYVPGAGGKNMTPVETPPFPDVWNTIKNLRGVPGDGKPGE